MSKRVLITFSGARYAATTNAIVQNGPKLGADEVRVYDDKWLLGTDFYRLNHWLWEHHGDQNNNPRGFGWFCWKPFVLLDALDRLQPGDVVLYTDADTYPVADFSMLFDHCRKMGGIMAFAARGCVNRNWNKYDCMAVMGQLEPFWRERPAAVARFMLFEAGKWKPRQFLMEWLTYCVNPLAQTFDPSVLGPEYPDLHEHRTEQAIYTNLCHKYGLYLHREACQFGADQQQDKELYPQLFFQCGLRFENGLNGSAYRNIEEVG